MQLPSHFDLKRTRTNSLRIFSLDNGMKILASREKHTLRGETSLALFHDGFVIALKTARRMEATECAHLVSPATPVTLTVNVLYQPNTKSENLKHLYSVY